MTRPLAVLIASFVLGCMGKPDDEGSTAHDTAQDSSTDDDPTDSTRFGQVTGTVMEDYPWDELEAQLAPGARVFARSVQDDTVIETIATTDGSFTLPLPVGGWQLTAMTVDLRCMSVDTARVTLTEESTETVSLTIDACTRDGDTG